MQTTDKLNSLPEDLRKEANRLIASKFCEPSVPVASTPGNQYRSPPTVVKFPYYEGVKFAAHGDEDVLMPNPEPTHHIIENHTQQEIERIAHSLSSPQADGYRASVSFDFSPIGAFVSHHLDMYSLIDDIKKQSLEFEIYRGIPATNILARLMAHMTSLSVYYGGGYFICHLCNWTIDRSLMYEYRFTR